MLTLKHRLFHPLLTVLVLLMLSNTAWAEVKAFLNQNKFYEGDPITLHLETSSNGNTKPNLSPLNKDFDILGTSSSTQINILNGRKRVKKSWSIELQPKNKGSLQIPAIHIGQEVTSALDLKIIDIPANLEEETKKHIFVESSVDIAGKSSYVQQQIPYTVKLYFDASMINGKIYSPSVENAIVEQLGEERRYRTLRNGKKYSVIEKHFVISPEKSGKLHIPATTVKGRMRVASANDLNNQNQRLQRNNQDTDFLNRFFNNTPFANDPFFKDFGGDFFSNRRTASKPFTTKSETIDVNVQPLPSEFKGQSWLPAEELTIEDSWTTSPPELRIGEPVSRILRLQAKGLAGSQIPKVEIPKPNNIRTYTDQEKTETRTDGKTVYGISEMKITYIPDESGSITIPAIKLDWWNVITKKQETFIIPEWNLRVSAVISGATPQTDDASLLVENQTVNTANLTSETEKSKLTSNSYTTLYWLLSLLALLTFLLVATLTYFYTSKRNHTSSKKMSKNSHSSHSIHTIKKALHQACHDNQQHEAAKQLLRLANASWKGNSPQNLGSLAMQVTQGKDAILELQRSLYAKNKRQWNGARLCDAIKNGLQVKSTITQKQNSELKPLYPTL